MVNFPIVYSILRPRLKKHEGVRLKPYRDSKGLWTIGIGRCLETKGISLEEANYFLENDIRDATDEVVEKIPWSIELDEERFSVLVEMANQMGINGLLTFKRFLFLLEIHNYDEAATEMLNSKWAKEDSPKRALELSDIIRGVKT